MIELAIISEIQKGSLIAMSYKSYKSVRLCAEYLESVVVSPEQIPEGNTKKLVMMGDFSDEDGKIWRAYFQKSKA